MTQQIYASSGRAWLVCPRLLEIEPRYKEHHSRWPLCRQGQLCPLDHKHESPLADGQGHKVNDFVWLAGCRPPTPDEHPVCGCGRKLVHCDLDDLYAAENLIESA